MPSSTRRHSTRPAPRPGRPDPLVCKNNPTGDPERAAVIDRAQQLANRPSAVRPPDPASPVTRAVSQTMADAQAAAEDLTLAQLGVPCHQRPLWRQLHGYPPLDTTPRPFPLPMHGGTRADGTPIPRSKERA